MAQVTLQSLWKKTSKRPRDHDETETESDKDNSEQRTKKRRTTTQYPKCFQQKWLLEFEWLKKDDSRGMFCEVCTGMAHCKTSPFSVGSKNFQRSALVRHQMSKDHIISMQAKRQQNYMDAAKTCVKKKYLPILEAQLKTALFLAKENIANRKFLSLIDLQISNGSTVFQKASSAGQSSATTSMSSRGIYTNHQAPADMQKALADVLREMTIVRVKESPFVGIMVDESMDIATDKKLIMFCKIVYGGQIKIEFCANVTVPDGKADTIYNSIVNWMNSVGITFKNISGFGSDGASVMTGRLSGVGVKLREQNPRIIHIWCAAHRLALVSHWAAKKVPYLGRVQEMLVAIYFFYEFSAPRYNKIKELKKNHEGKSEKI
ncbi:uncharacterized protein C17orf113-like [Argopecten irradians]|uniref:uncharacterized protein C17orf113-like n=1 Tax=Argopecten irradians TaxID=31199 RepID=UPI003718D288